MIVCYDQFRDYVYLSVLGLENFHYTPDMTDEQDAVIIRDQT